MSDMDDSKLSGAMDPSGKYVISTRIRVGRNIRGFGLSPGIKRADRAAVEKLVRVRAWLCRARRLRAGADELRGLWCRVLLSVVRRRLCLR